MKNLTNTVAYLRNSNQRLAGWTMFWCWWIKQLLNPTG